MARLLLALVCILAVGCGSDEGGGGEDPLAALDAAAKKTKSAESNRQQFTLEAEGGGERLSMTGEATMSADSTRGRMTFKAEGSSAIKGSFEALTVDGVIYMKGDGIPLPPGKEWLKAQDPPTSTMSPSEFVGFLRDSGDVENEGTEEIRGRQTTHFSGPLDIRKVAEASGSQIVERLNRTPDAEKMDTQIDIWVGEDGLPARMMLEVEPPDGQEGQMTMTTDVLEYNVDVDVKPPPASKVAGS